ncbi:RHS repeat-associated core domain-containing protein, partial [Pseudomonas tohonis]|uniref:RHS repeat-associated core domain-containing protein n=1 Tax=Pseudomonas tohonis TaxID=2725477 RepID=UPI001F41C531
NIDVILRFPGQVADAHSALYYNYFRDYDPETGRYVESDPIGLMGGLNTYGYVMGNPIEFMDPYGLDSAALNPADLLKPYTYPAWIRGIPAVISLPAAVGTFCLAYPNNSLADPKLSECPQNGCYYSNSDSGDRERKKPKPGTSGKDGAKDVPSWAKGERPFKGESGKDFADRLLGEKYGPGNYPTGPGSEHNKIRKYGDRAFE